MYFPPGYDAKFARLNCELAAVAYDQLTEWLDLGKPKGEDHFVWKPPAMPALTYSQPFWSDEKLLGFLSEAEPFGFVAHDDSGNGFLVFRGTDSKPDWLDDLDASQCAYELVENHGRVHRGFYELYSGMRTRVLEMLAGLQGIETLWVTGHSLGCGLSTCAVPDIVSQCNFPQVVHYNFASPRVGDPDFAEAYNENSVFTVRVVNTCDLVPEVPPSVAVEIFQHIGNPVNFTAQYRSVGGNHAVRGSYLYALKHPEAPENREAQGNTHNLPT